MQGMRERTKERKRKTETEKKIKLVMSGKQTERKNFPSSVTYTHIHTYMYNIYIRCDATNLCVRSQTCACIHGSASHQTTLHQFVGVVSHDLSVFASSWFPLIRIHHQVLGTEREREIVGNYVQYPSATRYKARVNYTSLHAEANTCLYIVK